MVTKSHEISTALLGMRKVAPVFFKKAVSMDFSSANASLERVDIADTQAFSRWVVDFLEDNGCDAGIGGYLEDRMIYRRSPLFKGRTIHLGVDVWVPAGTDVRSPLDGRVESFRYNGDFGDYGTTIILEHEVGSIRFWTLYGHLNRKSICGKQEGLDVKAGECFAKVGDMTENGTWPPHLHFQVTGDLGGYVGDFPGVCAPVDTERFMEICPDPMIFFPSRSM